MRMWVRRAVVATGAWGLVGLLALGAYAQERRECADFATQEEAQRFFEERGGLDGDHAHLDVDRDGIACEGLPSAGPARTPGVTPTPTPIPRVTPAPTPRDELPENGAGTLVLALSGVTLLEAGYGMTLWAKRLGVRRREVPFHMLRRLGGARMSHDVFEASGNGAATPGATEGPSGAAASRVSGGPATFTGGSVYAILAATRRIELGRNAAVPEPENMAASNGHSPTTGDEPFLSAEDGPLWIETQTPGTYEPEAEEQSPAIEYSTESEDPAVDEFVAHTLRERSAWPFFTPPN